MPPILETSDARLKGDLVGSIPHLRAFAISLSGNADRADDLVQETLVKAWLHLGSFAEGSNLERGFSRSCETRTFRNIASGDAKFRILTECSPT